MTMLRLIQQQIRIYLIIFHDREEFKSYFEKCLWLTELKHKKITLHQLIIIIIKNYNNKIENQKLKSSHLNINNNNNKIKLKFKAWNKKKILILMTFMIYCAWWWWWWLLILWWYKASKWTQSNKAKFKYRTYYYDKKYKKEITIFKKLNNSYEMVIHYSARIRANLKLTHSEINSTISSKIGNEKIYLAC